MIMHVVTSSRGSKSYGAINTPRTKEANIFHEIERIDSQMGLFEQLERTTVGGNFVKQFDKTYCLEDYDNL